MSLLNSQALLIVLLSAQLLSGLPASADIETVDTWNALLADGLNAQSSGDYVRGLEITERGLRTAQALFGKRDARTLTTLNLLGELSFAQQLYDKAEQFYAEALNMRSQVLGARHPDTLASIAAWQRSRG